MVTIDKYIDKYHERHTAISRLPAEILRLILDLALAIRENTLTNPTAHLNQYIPSSSEYLLVSKSWLEGGLPLL
ncbi:hypothetical protein ACEPAF_416 [Sanghuangporus sanghuang]